MELFKTTDIGRLNDGTLVKRGRKIAFQNVGDVDAVVHPSIMHTVHSYQILSSQMAILYLQTMHHKRIIIINCCSPIS